MKSATRQKSAGLHSDKCSCRSPRSGGENYKNNVVGVNVICIDPLLCCSALAEDCARLLVVHHTSLKHLCGQFFRAAAS